MTDHQDLPDPGTVEADEHDEKAELLSASKPAVAALPDEVKHALTHAIGGWRGAACDTRDDAEGERRSADYNRRAQVIEDWLAASPQATATQPSPTAVVLDDERAAWVHELKTDAEVFAAVLDGSKTHEIRFNDRDFKIGDTLRLRETRYTGQEMRGPEPRPLEFTGREVTRVVSHVLEGYGLKPGWVILSLARATIPQPVAQPVEHSDEWRAGYVAGCNDSESKFNFAQGVEPVISENLHPDTAKLVRRFARALGNKLLSAQIKYGYSNNWQRDDWANECRAELMRHIAKGDPRDVAAYCAFLWHHDWPTAAAQPVEQTRALTDEQIKDIAKEHFFNGMPILTCAVEFARTLLTAALPASGEPRSQ